MGAAGALSAGMRATQACNVNSFELRVTECLAEALPQAF